MSNEVIDGSVHPLYPPFFMTFLLSSHRTGTSDPSSSAPIHGYPHYRTMNEVSRTTRHSNLEDSVWKLWSELD
jgi:hypothetical protein